MSDALRPCTTLDGRQIALPRARFVVRPSVYARIIHQDAVLLVTNTRSGRVYLPDGGIEPGEALPEALAREVWEEAGITIADLQLLSVSEDFSITTRPTRPTTRYSLSTPPSRAI